MAQPVAQAAPAMQKMMVTVPSDCYGGQPLQVQTPAGLLQVRGGGGGGGVRLPPPPPLCLSPPSCHQRHQLLATAHNGFACSR